MQRGSCSGGDENHGPKNRPGPAQPAFTGRGLHQPYEHRVPGFSYSTFSRESSAALIGEWERALVDRSRVPSQSECGSLSAAQTATNVESTKTSENASTHAGAPTQPDPVVGVEWRTLVASAMPPVSRDKRSQ